jgi:hypothetical protein
MYRIYQILIMKGIKLTPFLLFVMLLVVLVFAMIFGSYMKPVLENMENSGETSTWNNVNEDITVTAYNGNDKLYTIFPIIAGKNGYFFDGNNGSVIVTNDLTNSSDFTLLTRDSSGVPVTSENELETAPSQLIKTSSPWTYVDTANNFSILYCPNDANTLIIVIDNANNRIKQVFKSSKGISTTILPSNLDTAVKNNNNKRDYSTAGSQENVDITINGNTVQATKIAKQVFYSDEKGIVVGTPDNTLKASKDFKTGVTRLSTDNILVIGCLIDDNSLLIVIIVKETDSAVYEVASSNYKQYTYVDGNPNDSASVTVTTGSGSDSSSGSSGSGSGSGSSPGSGANVNLCPNSGYSGSGSGSKCDDSDYIKKTEIVPPVCPMCPSFSANASTCNLSIDSNGEIIDCNGKKYQPSDFVSGASPATFGGSLGSSIENVSDDIADIATTGITEAGDVLKGTVDTAGDVVDKTLDTAGEALDTTVDAAGNVVDKTLDTAGNVVDKTLDTASGALDTTVDAAGNIIGGVGDTIGDVASGLGQGLSGLGQGASEMVQGVSSNVADLGGNVIDSTTGLIRDTGSGFMQLSQQQQQQMLQQQQQMGQQGGMMPQAQGYGQGGMMPQAQGYGQGGMMPQGYGQGGMMPQGQGGYSYPQQCANNESNFMPITSDFSQFT